ncbi:MAG: ATP-binding protein [Sphingomonadales bacterium]
MEQRERAVGRVIAIAGSSVTCSIGAYVDHDPADGGTDAAIRIGSLVKAEMPGSTVFGLVSALRIENVDARPSSAGSSSNEKLPSSDETYIAEIDLYGQVVSGHESDGPGRFERGVSTYPALGQPIFATTSDDLRLVYARPADSSIRVGTVLQGQDLPAYLVTDDLLGKHFAVLGTTGGGKSCAVTLVLRAVLDAHPKGHIVVLDPHDEYSGCFADAAECLNLNNINLPYWLLNFEETAAVLASNEGRDREIEADILRPALLAARKSGTVQGRKFLNVTVDTPVPYRLTELIRHLDQAMGRLNKPDDSRPYLRLKARLETLTSDKRFSFMFGSPRVQDSMVEVMARLLRIPNVDKPMTIIDLSGIPADIVDVVVSLLCRLIFDFSVWSEQPERHPLLLVCEEAHRYIPADDVQSFEPTRKAIARIAKEGRKYGVSLGLVTQRPSEISTGVLSQCNTIIAMRMSNEQDQEFVRRTLPENALGLLNALPSLQTREAIAIGEGAPIPVRFRFDNLPVARQPRGSQVKFSSAWRSEDALVGVTARTVDRWRRHKR